jgi:transducin (beta)-like 1
MRRSLNMNNSVVAVAFTPDGAFIAGATEKTILIWKVDDLGVGLPRASWTRDSESGWQSPKANGSTQMEDHYCLCWDSNGQKLAFGANSQVSLVPELLEFTLTTGQLAIIDFRR